ncbi:MAG: tRNA (guanosine(37)-N1)-methyltransferase TrmD [Patescibacteria group bacterium]|nr:tRNA (guanosine(37)-N1)-methyltransferase TrmD [Patescibacteria group bacterium]
MLISIITLFPEMFQGVFDYSIIKRAKEKKLVEINLVNLRDFGIGNHKTVDDKPYGGGTGMVLKVDVLEKAVANTKKGIKSEKVILLDPKGEVYDQKIAKNFSKLDHLILICGRYEGFDERIRNFIDAEISIGDYVLSGGEIPAMAITDSVVRLVKGVLPKEEATVFESFSEIENQKLLEYPQYTRPEEYKGLKVPKVLLSGNEKEIKEFRQKEALKTTKKRRPDILKSK